MSSAARDASSQSQGAWLSNWSIKIRCSRPENWAFIDQREQIYYLFVVKNENSSGVNRALLAGLSLCFTMAAVGCSSDSPGGSQSGDAGSAGKSAAGQAGAPSSQAGSAPGGQAGQGMGGGSAAGAAGMGGVAAGSGGAGGEGGGAPQPDPLVDR